MAERQLSIAALAFVCALALAGPSLAAPAIPMPDPTPAGIEMSNRVIHFETWWGDQSHQLILDASLQAPGKPDTRSPLTIASYDLWLRGSPYASVEGRYDRLLSDIEADSDLLPDLAKAVCAVERIDAQRIAATARLPAPEPDFRAGIDLRIADNQSEIAHLEASLDFRIASYGYALDHLIAADPDPVAQDVDAGLARLSRRISTLRHRGFCATSLPVSNAGIGHRRDRPSRFLNGNPAPKAAPQGS